MAERLEPLEEGSAQDIRSVHGRATLNFDEGRTDGERLGVLEGARHRHRDHAFVETLVDRRASEGNSDSNVATAFLARTISERGGRWRV